ncbi:hypothetical protein ACA910_011422 [Epithemia clementina (nom. ined.)]
MCCVPLTTPTGIEYSNNRSTSVCSILRLRFRKKLFGPERAFLPLTLTGTGALTAQDLMSFQAGFPAMLPDATTGHKCVFADRRKRLPTLTIENHLRCYFYVHKILAENDLSQVDCAMVFVLAVTPRSNDTFDPELVNRRASLDKTIFPIKMQFHFLCIPQKRKPTFGANIVNDGVNTLRKYFLKWMDVQVHFETEPNKILNELLELGLTKEGIPLMVGGDWKFEDFAQWCQERVEWENEHYKDRLLDVNCAFGESRTASMMNWTKVKPSDVAVAKESKDSEEDDKVTKRRMADRFYSRQKRERQRVRFQSLKEESIQLEDTNKKLKAEHDRLRRLLIEAEESVTELSEAGGRGGFF